MHTAPLLRASTCSTEQYGLRLPSSASLSKWQSYLTSCRPTLQSTHFTRQVRQARWLPTHSSDVLPIIKDFTTENPISVFHSSSNNPYHNLAIENYLLKHSHPNSRILFTYTNRPCVVIGRNQNPWLECNIAEVQQGLPWRAEDWSSFNGTYAEFPYSYADGVTRPLDLVRRRSGGGTVIHDAGNLNFSFIVPNDKDFTRNMHAQLVVVALREYRKRDNDTSFGTPLYEKVRVNERHDIVMTRLAAETESEERKEYKASGSAFKLTRGRALHHGTILHSSPNVRQPFADGGEKKSVFSTLLSSPAAPYLEAKGVGSVRSPVHNLFDISQPSDRHSLAMSLANAICDTFQEAYRLSNGAWIPRILVRDDDCHAQANKEIYDDAQELATDDWRFCQTPSFEYNSHAIGGCQISFQVKQGIIKSPKSRLMLSNNNALQTLDVLEGKKLHEVHSWDEIFSESGMSALKDLRAHLAEVFPAIKLAGSGEQRTGFDKIVEEKSIGQERRGEAAIKRRSVTGINETEQGGENVVMEH